jgi:hypothetical protein
VSLERLATFVLSIPEGVVERRTAVHPVRAFTSTASWCAASSPGHAATIYQVRRSYEKIGPQQLATRAA